ncbi:polysaccharide pyruvyl transferase family protein [Photobacterium sp. CAU 1568]|uniref:Polysaccharide pyruvyl transferase family protein n=1 Tax=Photobacterium arenosum TaxID=2774143 RepID=A0ABR9BPD0_9GAMM|nr:polysaccharide pyruvyl transferase family protein [Photobacterium arenosum]MBD8514419.1 polysaccharide pyruvyl transferase family protein [Photobacterium arenosum]
MKTLLFGYYGYGNYGDDLMLKVIDDYSSSNVTVFTSSSVKEQLNLKSKEVIFKRFHFDLIKNIVKHKQVVWGGGTCFYSNKTNLFMLLLVSIYTRLLGRKIIFFSVGVGRINGFLDKLISILVFNLSSEIYLRDKCSQELVSRFTFKKKGKIVEDLFLLSNVNALEQRKTGSNKIVFNLSSECVTEENIVKVIELAEYLESELSFDVEFISLQNVGNSPENTFYADQPFMNDRRFVKYNSPVELHDAISSCKLFIGFRLHGLLTAISAGVPILAYPYSPKVVRMLDNFILEPELVTLEMGQVPTLESIIKAISRENKYKETDQDLIRKTERELNEIIL